MAFIRDQPDRPAWWDWELELSPHLLKRMLDRSFTEVELRAMLENGRDVFPDREPGRWVISTRREDREWHVIVEPIASERALVVVTAYPVSDPK